MKNGRSGSVNPYIQYHEHDPIGYGDAIFYVPDFCQALWMITGTVPVSHINSAQAAVYQHSPKVNVQGYGGNRPVAAFATPLYQFTAADLENALLNVE